jgi:predicted GNAT superfamily acetyltransferase
MVLGRIGLFTTAVETLATAVGGGIVLGGFLAGSVGMVAGWTSTLRDQRILLTGYCGGMAGVVLVLIDLAVRYIR